MRLFAGHGAQSLVAAHKTPLPGSQCLNFVILLQLAQEQLTRMGPMSTNERIMLATMGAAVCLWVSGRSCACGCLICFQKGRSAHGDSPCCGQGLCVELFVMWLLGCQGMLEHSSTPRGGHCWCLGPLSLQTLERPSLSMQTHKGTARVRCNPISPPPQVAGDMLGISAVVTAMLGLCALLSTGVLTWRDCIGHPAAWDTLFWFAGGT